MTDSLPIMATDNNSMVPVKKTSTPSPIDSPILSASPSSTFSLTPAISPSMTAASASSRSFSNESAVSITSYSSRSSNRSCSLPIASAGNRRRGYIRPQGATFAPSAQSRDSVLSLGSIAHLQYYFARTGLLDGKGGQLAKTKQNGDYDLPIPSRFSLSRAGSDAGSSVMESPIEEEGARLWDAAQEYGDEVMLPPTVSTYTTRGHEVAPPPDQRVLKKDLVDALENALHALETTQPSPPSEGKTNSPGKGVEGTDTKSDGNQAIHEIGGLHILDRVTLAIGAARVYYTHHPRPTILNSIKSDLQIRRELMSVLDVLKKWAGRKFAGGLREDERLAILCWVSDVGAMIDAEARIEEAERSERQGWRWADDTLWKAEGDGERELAFLQSLLQATPQHDAAETLPPWTDAASAEQPSPLLTALADGRLLVRMHNAAVKRSKRPFGEIGTYHTDVAKPYRRADNLRFWIKAAEIRWEVKLAVSVMPVVTASRDAAVWQGFGDAVEKWSRSVREEIARDWREEDRKREVLHQRAKSLAGERLGLGMGMRTGKKNEQLETEPKKEETVIEESIQP